MLLWPESSVSMNHIYIFVCVWICVHVCGEVVVVEMSVETRGQPGGIMYHSLYNAYLIL